MLETVQIPKWELRLKASSVTNRTHENFGRHNFYLFFLVRRKSLQQQTKSPTHSLTLLFHVSCSLFPCWPAHSGELQKSHYLLRYAWLSVRGPLDSRQTSFHETLRLAVLLLLQFCFKLDNNNWYTQASLLTYQVTKWKRQNCYIVLKIPKLFLLPCVIYVVRIVQCHFLWTYVHTLHFTTTF